MVGCWPHLFNAYIYCDYLYCWPPSLSVGRVFLEEMGPSVDVVGSSARSPILEVLRHDEEEVIIPLRCPGLGVYHFCDNL